MEGKTLVNLFQRGLVLPIRFQIFSMADIITTNANY
jgi:hypothetical protein